MLELVVVASILAIFAGILLNRMLYYQEVAEKMNMETTAGTLRSALLLKIAEYMTTGRTIEYEQIAQENPMDWLEVKPPNYVGAFSGSPPEGASSGSWYFDLSSRILVYRIGSGRYFLPDSHNLKQVRFRLVLSYSGIQGDGAIRDSPMVASGITLSVIEPYRWLLP
ncbi:MAG: type II secretion system GspH family protein [Gammaproteobacteria bacterium]|nr:type II secretion system GspH family protein [Gammaproteobacteria bacterium]MBU1733256.1 type II secretion system GspH family protein [Gammaproteobacteria bacterium]MBU1892304.1 type II secretion system GspH family protein [Gammaproteobacteria bacterium]